MSTKKILPVHADMNQFSVEHAQLLIGGYTLDGVADILGKQVFYAYDKSVRRPLALCLGRGFSHHASELTAPVVHAHFSSVVHAKRPRTNQDPHPAKAPAHPGVAVPSHIACRRRRF